MKETLKEQSDKEKNPSQQSKSKNERKTKSAPIQSVTSASKTAVCGITK